MSAPDFLLVNPPSRDRAYQVLANSLAAVEPPVWVGLIASYLIGKGYSVEILDANAHGYGPKETASAVEDCGALLTAVIPYGHNPSASTQVMAGASPTCTEVKARNPGRRLIMVGGHAAALPERTLREEDVDYVCDGEGPTTLAALVEAIRAGEEDLSKVPGLWYFDQGMPRHTRPSELIRDLDAEMPGIPWQMLPMGNYRSHNWHAFDDLERQPYAAIYTTLGCPYRCTFCCIQAPFKQGEAALGYKSAVNSYRFWSPETVLGWIDTLVRDHGVRHIKFADEMFVLNRRHVEGICDGIIERGYDLNIWAYARIDTVRDGMLPKLKKAGFNWLAFGIESANEDVRGNVDKRYTQAQLFETLAQVKAEGISNCANYIFGLTGDDRASIQQTLDLALEVNAEWANFYCTMAYPGSQLYTDAIEGGVALPRKWSGYSQYSVDSMPLRTEALTAADILRFRDEAFVKYYDRPAYLQMLEKRFGADAVKHVHQMLSHTLERELLSGGGDLARVG